MRNIRHNHRGRCFPGIPIQVNEGTVTGGKVVIAIEDGRKYDKSPEGKDGAENEFPTNSKR